MEHTQTLDQALLSSGAAKLSSFAGVVLMACLFGRNLLHLHRPDADEAGDQDLNGEFWKRHRSMDGILLNTSLNLPGHLKLPAGLGNPNIVFTNMNIHTSTICLHQAAIYKADRNRLPASVSKDSKLRCITAASEITGIMKMISHLDLERFNPFMSFCLYVAARVFVQYLKSRPDDDSIADSLRFMLQAMNAMKSKNPLTESFLVQLDVDLESLGVRNIKFKHFTQYARGMKERINDSYRAQAAAEPSVQADQCSYLKIIDELGCDSAPRSRNFANTPSTSTDEVNIMNSATGYSSQTRTNKPTNGSDTTRNQYGQTLSPDFNPEGLAWMPQDAAASNSESQPHMLKGLFPNAGIGNVYDDLQSQRPNLSLNRANGGKVLSHVGEVDFSDQVCSDRPTPSATSPSTHSSSNPSSMLNQMPSAYTSFETSPVASSRTSFVQIPVDKSVGSYADETFNYGVNSGGIGLMPGATGMNPGRTPVGDHSMMNGWEMPISVGEGVMMMMMDMDPMWEVPTAHK